MCSSSGTRYSRCPLTVDGVHSTDPVSLPRRFLVFGAPSSAMSSHYRFSAHGDCRSTSTSLATFTGDCRSTSTPLATFTGRAGAYGTLGDASHMRLPSAFDARLSMASTSPSAHADDVGHAIPRSLAVSSGAGGCSTHDATMSPASAVFTEEDIV